MQKKKKREREKKRKEKDRDREEILKEEISKSDKVSIMIDEEPKNFRFKLGETKIFPLKDF